MSPFYFREFMSAYNPPLIFGPIAPENNPPIEPQFFQPSVFNIAALVQTAGAQTITVTTTVNHNYVVGQSVRLVIPSIYGAQAYNEQPANVISIPAANQVILNIFNPNANAFTSNPTSGTTQPQILAVGDVNSGRINTTGRSNTGTFISGSFHNISPL
jgi:hypothetical protein